MPSQQRTTRRKILMPIAIVVAAAVIAIWGWQAESQRVSDVKEYVFLICEDIANGRDPESRLGRLDPDTSKQMVDFIKVLCEDLPEDLTGLEIVVHSGDSPETGNGAATHTAMIRTNGKDKLGLRIVHQSIGGDMGIIGIWWPR